MKNYKNFKDTITINFKDIAGYQFNTECISDGIISKMLIYGKNATGKTNLGRALMDIHSTLFSSPFLMTDGIFLNADSTENYASFSYEFQFEDNEVIYKYTKFSEYELRDEELLINKKSIFKWDFVNEDYNVDNLGEINAETAIVERYIQSLEGDITGEIEPKLSFLKWLLGNVAFKSDSVLILLSEYIRRMKRITVSNIMTRHKLVNERFFETLEEPEQLKDLEDFLNAMGIECKLILEKLPDGQRELYFRHERLVPFYGNASSGTLALVNLYRNFVSVVREASFIYLDEFDAFYHYEMAEKVIEFFKNRYPKCQMILTSHNTNLMVNRLMRPDCVFILSRGGSLTALCKATDRELREGHNLEKMYISGEFEKYE